MEINKKNIFGLSLKIWIVYISKNTPVTAQVIHFSIVSTLR